MNNYPPGAANDPAAPYNEKTKIIEVNVSQCLSTTVSIEVSEDFDEFDNNALMDTVREQVILPSEAILDNSSDCWYLDDFCVSL